VALPKRKRKGFRVKDKVIRVVSTCWVLIFLVSSCGETATPDTWAGEWKATSEFGEFRFLVNDSGAIVYHVDYRFRSCSEAILRGEVEIAGWINPREGFSIDNREFSFSTQTPEMEIEGRFTTDGQLARGHWIAGACEGNWEARKVRESSEIQRIAFVSNRDGNDEIYVTNVYGFDQTNLTKHPSPDVDPSWSPDGSKIVFTSERDGNQEVYVMNADGSEQTNLTNNSAQDHSASWAPDGTRIAFVSDRDGNSEIYIMNADGSGQTNLTKNQAVDSMPVWSPTGENIAFSSDRDGNEEIYVMNGDGSGQTNLSNNPERDHFHSWSPDGTQIVFASLQQLPGVSFTVSDLFVVNTDGSGLTNLTNSDWHQSFPAWSPDGTLISYSSFDTLNSNTCLLDLYDSHDSLFGCIDGGSTRYDWSPDSFWIAYQCYQSGNSKTDICVITIDGSQKMNLTNQPDYTDQDPVWSP
jgi:Tol biopolymer transport system component